ncbi:ABC transporter ATP-binding protein [Paenibacillus thermotolerans]|uniref:ABC transporter ATP-binding protein n=1 Tax=Paenibacillus thermotolerans TaxID=3027807 RepID=UPI0023684ADC|nr:MULTISPECIES: ABC transporter transmembrane domain-containing protein [unclassified Paenibacillus]
MKAIEETIAAKRIVPRLIAYLRPHRLRLSAAFLVLFASTGASILGPILIKYVMDEYVVEGRYPFRELALLGAGYLGLIVAGELLNYVQRYQFQVIAHRVIQAIRIDVFSKVQRLGLSFFDRTPGGSLVSRITNDTESIKDLYVSVLSTFVQNIVLLAGIFIGMFILDVRLGAMCLVLVPIILALMQTFRMLSGKIYHEVREKLSQLNAKLNESLQGMNVIQAMRQQERLRREFGAINAGHYFAYLKQVRLVGLLVRPAVDLIYLFALMLMLGHFGFDFLGGAAVEIGVVYAFMNYLGRFFEPVNEMMFQLTNFQQATVSASRVFGLLDEDRLAPDRKEAAELGQGAASESGSAPNPPIVSAGRVEFRNVTFSYDGVNPVLKNITFTAEPGQTVALVGHTGSGKSSIVNLLMRFYEIDSGRITIDGAPLSAFRDEELRRSIGLVLQDPFLFVGDIAFNIRLHNDAITDEQVMEAALFVQADPFIRRYERGYAEPVGERGATFSSGQRQLISFARTIVQQPKILVLDEATAAVDTETEEAIQEALERMRRGRTTIAIAHRLSTVQDADLILVLHQGEIVERGTHRELLAQEGLYHKMYLLQQGASAAAR